MVFVSKKDMRNVLIEKKLVTATSFKNRCERKSWKRTNFKYYDAVLSSFDLLVDDKKHLNHRRDKVFRCLSNDKSLGVDFEVKRNTFETSYCEESDDETPDQSSSKQADVEDCIKSGQCLSWTNTAIGEYFIILFLTYYKNPRSERSSSILCGTVRQPWSLRLWSLWL